MLTTGEREDREKGREHYNNGKYLRERQIAGRRYKGHI